MRLFIAEKPAMARAIVDALPGQFRKCAGYYQCADVQVSWCLGHLLELAEPDKYNASWAQWQLEPLPLIPERWKLKARKGGAAVQLKVLRELIKSADQIVHAGDPDREGQLLVDELFTHLRVSAARIGKIQRLLINDLNPGAIRKALQVLKPNSAFFNLSQSALARSHADWLYGINMTRAWTLLGQRQGYSGVLSVGRVQTPLLGLVVRRDQAIEAFSSQVFYQLDAGLTTAEGGFFWTHWQPSEACEKWQDEQGRMLHRPLCEHVVERITNQMGLVVEYKTKEGGEPPPLPFSLSALQITAGKRYRFSAAKVLELCQSLYEKHQLITYPRSDCRYLPVEQHGVGASIGQALAENCPALVKAVDEAQWGLRSRAFNDTKISAHHAIVPTEKRVSHSRLSVDESHLYQLIVQHYLAQFYPEYRYQKSSVTVEIEGGLFKAQTKSPLQQGWRCLLRQKKSDKPEPDQTPWPKLQRGDRLHCTQTRILEKQTTPPEPFTDGSLIAAMTGIARFVVDPEIRKVLRETDGLGTEATRASIIETLLKRQLLLREGRVIHASTAGRSLIEALPAETTQADMTARWESQLEQIYEGGVEYSGFLATLETTLQGLIESARRDGGRALAVLSGTGVSWGKKRGRKKVGKTRRAQPKKKTVQGKTKTRCPSCGKGMVTRKGPRGTFLGCSGYPECRTTTACDVR